MIINQETHLDYLVCTMPKNRGVLAFFTFHIGYELKRVKYDVYIYTLM